MNRRVGQRIVRDRWGEPIASSPPNPVHPIPKSWHLHIFKWLWRNSRIGFGKKENRSGQGDRRIFRDKFDEPDPAG